MLNTICVESGVTQGSNLGPLVFIIYFNNVATGIWTHKFIFADDLKITHVIQTLSDCMELQTDIENVTRWYQKNKRFKYR